MFNKSKLVGEGWLLLAQIEEEPTMCFADGGALYYLIPAQDLTDRRFDRTAVILQSH
jgi:hypothetical protein